ncbi:hypothetical protein B0H14DRAFT_2625714 [Mycena olivaceomarginata]|nr:hypothetical protein B0H14DRAFT_2625714 [Mycena olivaceomarginata]
MPKVKQVRRKPVRNFHIYHSESSKYTIPRPAFAVTKRRWDAIVLPRAISGQKHNMECAYPDAGIPSRRRSCSDKGQVIQSTKNMQIVLVPCGGDLVGSSSVGFDASWDSPSPGVPIGRWEYASQIFPPPSQRFYDESWGPA